MVGKIYRMRIHNSSSGVTREVSGLFRGDGASLRSNFLISLMSVSFLFKDSSRLDLVI